MGKTGNETKRLIGEIKKFMKRAGVSDGILFGSRADDTYLEDSDVDLILISDKFKGTKFVERLYPLHKAWTLPYYLEVLPYTPQELKSLKIKKRGVILAALKRGIRISA